MNRVSFRTMCPQRLYAVFSHVIGSAPVSRLYERTLRTTGTRSLFTVTNDADKILWSMSVADVRNWLDVFNAAGYVGSTAFNTTVGNSTPAPTHNAYAVLPVGMTRIFVDTEGPVTPYVFFSSNLSVLSTGVVWAPKSDVYETSKS